MDRKKRLFNRVLLVSGASAVLLFAGYVFFTFRSPRKFLIPKGYHGWVTVKFEKPGRPALPFEEGSTIFKVPESGILETSSKFESGWSRDDFFFYSGNEMEEISKAMDCGEEKCRIVHEVKEEARSYRDDILALGDGKDSTYWDDARIAKNGNAVNVRTGRKTMLHFWVSEKPEPFFYQHDSLPEARKVW